MNNDKETSIALGQKLINSLTTGNGLAIDDHIEHSIEQEKNLTRSRDNLVKVLDKEVTEDDNLLLDNRLEASVKDATDDTDFYLGFSEGFKNIALGTFDTPGKENRALDKAEDRYSNLGLSNDENSLVSSMVKERYKIKQINQSDVDALKMFEDGLMSQEEYNNHLKQSTIKRGTIKSQDSYLQYEELMENRPELFDVVEGYIKGVHDVTDWEKEDYTGNDGAYSKLHAQKVEQSISGDEDYKRIKAEWEEAKANGTPLENLAYKTQLALLYAKHSAMNKNAHSWGNDVGQLAAFLAPSLATGGIGTVIGAGTKAIKITQMASLGSIIFSDANRMREELKQIVVNHEKRALTEQEENLINVSTGLYALSSAGGIGALAKMTSSARRKKILGNLVSENLVNRVSKEAVDEVAKTATQQAVGALKSVAKAPVAGISEGLTEMGETALEEGALVNKDYVTEETIKNIGIAGASGFIGSGTVAGATNTAGAVAGVASKAADVTGTIQEKAATILRDDKKQAEIETTVNQEREEISKEIENRNAIGVDIEELTPFVEEGRKELSALKEKLLASGKYTDETLMQNKEFAKKFNVWNEADNKLEELKENYQNSITDEEVFKKATANRTQTEKTAKVALNKIKKERKKNNTTDSDDKILDIVLNAPKQINSINTEEIKDKDIKEIVSLLKDTDTVSEEFKYGQKQGEYYGIASYLGDMLLGKNEKNNTILNYGLDNITRLMSIHSNKLKVFQDAKQRFDDTGEIQYLALTKQGYKEVTEEQYSNTAPGKRAFINQKSTTLINNLQKENEFAIKTYQIARKLHSNYSNKKKETSQTNPTSATTLQEQLDRVNSNIAQREQEDKAVEAQTIIDSIDQTDTDLVSKVRSALNPGAGGIITSTTISNSKFAVNASKFKPNSPVFVHDIDSVEAKESIKKAIEAGSSIVTNNKTIIDRLEKGKNYIKKGSVYVKNTKPTKNTSNTTTASKITQSTLGRLYPDIGGVKRNTTYSIAKNKKDGEFKSGLALAIDVNSKDTKHYYSMRNNVINAGYVPTSEVIYARNDNGNIQKARVFKTGTFTVPNTYEEQMKIAGFYHGRNSKYLANAKSIFTAHEVADVVYGTVADTPNITLRSLSDQTNKKDNKIKDNSIIFANELVQPKNDQVVLVPYNVWNKYDNGAKNNYIVASVKGNSQIPNTSLLGNTQILIPEGLNNDQAEIAFLKGLDEALGKLKSRIPTDTKIESKDKLDINWIPDDIQSTGYDSKAAVQGVAQSNNIITQSQVQRQTNDIKKNVVLVKRYNVKNTKAHPDYLYVFGDNLTRKGNQGQAIIRGLKNAIGIATKTKPSRTEDSYFTDADLKQNKKYIDRDIKAILNKMKDNTYKGVIFPEDGLGTGLAELPTRAPETYNYLVEQLNKNFNLSYSKVTIETKEEEEVIEITPEEVLANAKQAIDDVAKHYEAQEKLYDTLDKIDQDIQRIIEDNKELNNQYYTLQNVDNNRDKFFEERDTLDTRIGLLEDLINSPTTEKSEVGKLKDELKSLQITRDRMKNNNRYFSQYNGLSREDFIDQYQDIEKQLQQNFEKELALDLEKADIEAQIKDSKVRVKVDTLNLTEAEIEALTPATRNHINKVQQEVYQRANKSLLQTVPNVYSNFIKNGVNKELMEHWLGDTLTTAQENVLNDFKRFNKVFMPALERKFNILLDNNNKKYLYINQLGLKGKSNEAILTAMSYAAFNYLVEQSGKTKNTASEVAAMYGYNEKNPTIYKDAAIHFTAGTLRDNVTLNLGRDVTKTLGVKFNENASMNSEVKLQQAVGQLITDVLERDLVATQQVDIGITEQVSVVMSVGGYWDTVSFLNERLKPVIGEHFDAIKFISQNKGYKGTKKALANMSKDTVFFNKTKRKMYVINTYRNKDLSLAQYGETKVNLVGLQRNHSEAYGILDNIFNATKEKRTPVLEKPRITQTKHKKTNTPLAKKQKQMMQKAANYPWIIDKKVGKQLLALYETGNIKAIKQMFNIPLDTKTALESIHEERKDSIQGEIENKWLEVTNAIAWLKNIETKDGFKDFYLIPEAWSNQRNGYATTLFNPQSSIVHRTLTTPKNSNTEVTIDSGFNEDGSTSYYGLWLNGLAEGMEGTVKEFNYTGNYDKNSRTNDKVHDKDFIPVMAEQVEYLLDNVNEPNSPVGAFKRHLEGDATENDYNLIGQFIELADSGDLALLSLRELALVSQYTETGKKSFKTAMQVSSDGVTNGVILFSLMTGTRSMEELSKGGILSKGMTSFHDLKREGMEDIYTDNGSSMKHVASTAYTIQDANSLFALLSVLENSFGTRKGAKNPTTQINYFAGNLSVLNGLNDTFEKAYYKALEKAKDQNDVNTIVSTVNAIVDILKSQKLPIKFGNIDSLFIDNIIFKDSLETIEINGIKVYKNNNVSTEHLNLINALNQAIFKNNLMGKNIYIPSNVTDKDGNVYQTSIRHYVEQLGIHTDKKDILNYILATQKEFNKQNPNINKIKKIEYIDYDHRLISEVSALPYSTASAIKQGISATRAMASIAVFRNNSAFNQTKKDINAITNQTYEVYKTVFETALKWRKQELGKDELTIAEYNKLLAEILPVKPKLQGGLSDINDKSTFIDGIKYGTEFDETQQIQTTIEGKTLTSYVRKDTIESPGVSLNPIQIQSVDSFISLHVFSEIMGLNTHDANHSSIADFAEMNMLQNKAMFDLVTSMSITESLSRMLIHSQLNAMNFLMHNPESYKAEDTRKIVATFKNQYGSQEFPRYLHDAVIEMANRELNALRELMENGYAIEQYAGKAAKYKITKEDREVIQKEIERRKAYINKAAQQLQIIKEYSETGVTLAEMNKELYHKRTAKNNHVTLTTTNIHTKKDQGKADIADAIIAYGLKGTSTYQYEQDFNKANKAISIMKVKGKTLFVSVNGKGKITEENSLATINKSKYYLDKGAYLIMDNAKHANTTYNKSGEGVVQQALIDAGYFRQRVNNGNYDYSILYKNRPSDAYFVEKNLIVLGEPDSKETKPIEIDNLEFKTILNAVNTNPVLAKLFKDLEIKGALKNRLSKLTIDENTSVATTISMVLNAIMQAAQDIGLNVEQQKEYDNLVKATRAVYNEINNTDTTTKFDLGVALNKLLTTLNNETDSVLVKKIIRIAKNVYKFFNNITKQDALNSFEKSLEIVLKASNKEAQNILIINDTFNEYATQKTLIDEVFEENPGLNNAKKILQEVKKKVQKLSKNHRLTYRINELLENIDSNLSIYIGTENGKSINRPQFKSLSSTIVLNGLNANTGQSSAYQALLHEIAHANSAYFLESNNELAKEFKKAFEKFKEDTDLGNELHKENAHEFLVYLYTNQGNEDDLAIFDKNTFETYFNKKITKKFFKEVFKINAEIRDKDKGQQELDFNAPIQNNVQSFKPSQVVSDLLGEKDDNLNHTMENIVDPIAQILQPYYTQSKNPQYIWDYIENVGGAVFTENLESYDIPLSKGQRYAVETLITALEGYFDNNADTSAYRQIEKLYDHAKEQTTYKDFLKVTNPTTEEIVTARNIYSTLFENEHRYLGKFMALALVSEDIKSVLEAKVTKSDKTLYETVRSDINSTIDWFNEKYSNKDDGTITDRADYLANKIAIIDKTTQDGSILEKTDKAIDKVTDTLNDISMPKSIQDLLDKLDKAPDDSYIHWVKMVREGRTIETFEGILESQQYGQFLGTFGSLLNELGGNRDKVRTGIALLRATKNREKFRTQQSETIEREIMSEFSKENRNKLFKDKDLITAITNMVLRTGLFRLQDAYTFQQIQELINDPNALQTEIDHRKNILQTKYQEGNHKVIRVKNLAKYMVTGLASEGLTKNARGISQGVLTNYFDSSKESTVEEHAIETLASLYALKYTLSRTKKSHLDFMNNEMNTDLQRNGIRSLMHAHSILDKESKKTFYDDNPYSYEYGHLPDMISDRVKIVVDNTNKEEEYKAQGYKVIKPMPNEQIMYLLPDNGTQRFVSGIFTPSSKKGRGTIAIQGNRLEDSHLLKLQDAMAVQAKENSDLYNPFDNGEEVPVVPRIMQNGNVYDYYHEMSHHTKDTYLQRDNNPAKIIGRMKSQSIDRATEYEHIKKIVTDLKKDYDDNKNIYGSSFVKIGAFAPTEKGRNYWRALGYDTQQEIVAQWGKSEMYVRKEIANMAFGYSGFSVSQLIEDNLENFDNKFKDKWYGDLATLLFKAVLGEKARLYVARGERLIIEGTGIVKNHWVIRSGYVGLNNFLFNAAFLLAAGVPPAYMIRKAKEGVVLARRYEKDYGELTQVNVQLSLKPNSKALQQRKKELEKRIERNPAKQLLEEYNLMPSMVEDIELHAKNTEYSSELGTWIADKYSYLPKSVQRVTDELLSNPGSTTYNLMDNFMAYGDFLAKYVLVQHKIENKEMDINEAVDFANDMFIDYDVPLDPTLHYMERVGITRFLKYRLRVQAGLFRLLQGSPISSIAYGTLGAYLFNKTYTDELLINRLGNPFGFVLADGVDIYKSPIWMNLLFK